MPDSTKQREDLLSFIGLGLLVFGRLTVAIVPLDKEIRMSFFKQKTTWTGLGTILASIGHAVMTRDIVGALPGLFAGFGLLAAPDAKNTVTATEVDEKIGTASAYSNLMPLKDSE